MTIHCTIMGSKMTAEKIASLMPLACAYIYSPYFHCACHFLGCINVNRPSADIILAPLKYSVFDWLFLGPWIAFLPKVNCETGEINVLSYSHLFSWFFSAHLCHSCTVLCMELWQRVLLVEVCASRVLLSSHAWCKSKDFTLLVPCPFPLLFKSEWLI